MQYSDLLQTFAEIAAAFAGFASLISLLGRSPDSIDRLRLIGMVRTALLVAAFSLFPFVPLALGTTEATVWRLSAGLLFLLSAANSFFVWRQLYRRWIKGLHPARSCTSAERAPPDVPVSGFTRYCRTAAIARSFGHPPH